MYMNFRMRTRVVRRYSIKRVRRRDNNITRTRTRTGNIHAILHVNQYSRIRPSRLLHKLLRPVSTRAVTRLNALFTMYRNRLTRRIASRSLLRLISFLTKISIHTFSLLLSVLLFINRVIMNVSRALCVHVFFRLSRGVLSIPFRFRRIRIRLINRRGTRIVQYNKRSISVLSRRRRLRRTRTRLLCVKTRSLFNLISTRIQN